MITCLFASDLHGKPDRYHKLSCEIITERPALVLLGGDLLPHGHNIKSGVHRFIEDFLAACFVEIKQTLNEDYPEVLLILGNDDPKINEVPIIEAGQKHGIWNYIHNCWYDFMGYSFLGYSIVPPTPFRLKDWEKYDVSPTLKPGHVPFESGFYSVDADKPPGIGTIEEDLNIHATKTIPGRSVFLFHSPPHLTKLDRIHSHTYGSDDIKDRHVGSVAIRNFIRESNPLLSLHGHIHESSRLTGSWKDQIGNSLCMNASHDGHELSVIKFDLENPWEASRKLI